MRFGRALASSVISTGGVLTPDRRLPDSFIGKKSLFGRDQPSLTYRVIRHSPCSAFRSSLLGSGLGSGAGANASDIMAMNGRMRRIDGLLGRGRIVPRVTGVGKWMPKHLSVGHFCQDRSSILIPYTAQSGETLS